MNWYHYLPKQDLVQTHFKTDWLLVLQYHFKTDWLSFGLYTCRVARKLKQLEILFKDQNCVTLQINLESNNIVWFQTQTCPYTQTIQKQL